MAFTTPYENKTQLIGTSADTKPTGVDKYTLFGIEVHGDFSFEYMTV